MILCARSLSAFKDACLTAPGLISGAVSQSTSCHVQMGCDWQFWLRWPTAYHSANSSTVIHSSCRLCLYLYGKYNHSFNQNRFARFSIIQTDLSRHEQQTIPAGEKKPSLAHELSSFHLTLEQTVSIMCGTLSVDRETTTDLSRYSIIKQIVSSTPLCIWLL